MLNVTDLRAGVVFEQDSSIFQVLSYEHTKMGRGSGNVKVKVKNLKTGTILEKAFTTGAKVEEAAVEKREAQFLYNDSDNFYFMDPVSFDQFPLSAQVIGEQAKFLKDNLKVNLIISKGEALGSELPNAIIYQILETGPGVKGNTISNVYKEAKLDNGLVVKVPLFIKVGEKVKIDTRSSEYIERVK